MDVLEFHGTGVMRSPSDCYGSGLRRSLSGHSGQEQSAALSRDLPHPANRWRFPAVFAELSGAEPPLMNRRLCLSKGANRRDGVSPLRGEPARRTGVATVDFVENRHATIIAPTHSRYAVTLAMRDRVTVIVSHRVGKVEAIHRLNEGFGHMKDGLGAMIAIEQQTWEGDTLHFHMRTLGQTAAGTIQVLDDALRIEVSLPYLLAQAAKRLLPILRKEATRLLERK